MTGKGKKPSKRTISSEEQLQCDPTGDGRLQAVCQGLSKLKAREGGCRTHQGGHERLAASIFQQPKGSPLKKVPRAGRHKQSAQWLVDGNSAVVMGIPGATDYGRGGNSGSGTDW